MILLHRLDLRDGVVEEALHLVEGCFLIALEGQHVVGVGLDNLFGDLFLAAQGVHRDEAAGQFERPQQGRHGGDFVALVGNLELAQHQAVGAGPGADDVARRLALGPRTAQGFAVHGDDLPGHGLAHTLGPAQETIEEGFGLEGGEDTVESVMAGDAGAQGEVGFEPVVLGAAELLHVVEGFAAAEQAAQGDDQDIARFMIAALDDARILEVGEQLDEGEGWGRSLHAAPCTHLVEVPR